MILVDTNVVVAALVRQHVHHEASAAYLASIDRPQTLFAAHSLAEAYSSLTRHGGHAPFRMTGDDAWQALSSIEAHVTVISLTPAQHVDAVRRFSDIGIGPRLYDYLIGRAGEIHGAETIVTWNAGHFRALFPHLAVRTP